MPVERCAAEQAHNAFVKSRLEAHLQTLPAGEYDRLIRAELDTLMRQYPHAIRDAMRPSAEATIRRSLIEQLHLPTFEQWKRQPPTSPSLATTSPESPDLPPPEPLPVPTHEPLPAPEPQPQPEPTPTKPSITTEAAEPPAANPTLTLMMFCRLYMTNVTSLAKLVALNSR
jgi:hypothetical protein